MSIDGEDIVHATQTKLALDYFRKLCMGNNSILPELVAEFDKETSGNKKMDAYVSLLKTAIDEVMGVQEQVGLDSLASPGGTTLFKDAIDSRNSIELVSYLIIK